MEENLISSWLFSNWNFFIMRNLWEYTVLWSMPRFFAVSLLLRPRFMALMIFSCERLNDWCGHFKQRFFSIVIRFLSPATNSSKRMDRFFLIVSRLLLWNKMTAFWTHKGSREELNVISFLVKITTAGHSDLYLFISWHNKYSPTSISVKIMSGFLKWSFMLLLWKQRSLIPLVLAISWVSSSMAFSK